MNKSTKAALLSAFVCPGAGHFFLKKYKMGLLFFGACCISFYFIIVDVIDKAQQIVDQMVTGKIALDVVSMAESISGITANSEQSLNAQMYILIVIWVVSIIDSYRVGGAEKE